MFLEIILLTLKSVFDINIFDVEFIFDWLPVAEPWWKRSVGVLNNLLKIFSFQQRRKMSKIFKSATSRNIKDLLTLGKFILKLQSEKVIILRRYQNSRYEKSPFLTRFSRCLTVFFRLICILGLFFHIAPFVIL